MGKTGLAVGDLKGSFFRGYVDIDADVDVDADSLRAVSRWFKGQFIQVLLNGLAAVMLLRFPV